MEQGTLDLDSSILNEKIQKIKLQQLKTRAKAFSQTQLQFWRETKRCAPNIILRSSLFNGKNRKTPRQYLKDEDIYVIGDGSISYRGEELRQDDKLVWMQLIHLARLQPIGHPVTFMPYTLCQSLGWGRSKKDKERLLESLSRMQATSLKVKSSQLKEGFAESMIPFFFWCDKEGKESKGWQVVLAPGLVDLFNESAFTRMEWEFIKSLPAGLASWLFSYFSSHAAPYPIKVETIAKGAKLAYAEKENPTASDKKELRLTVINALTVLKETGFITDYKVEKGLVSVLRTKLTYENERAPGQYF